jgi:hypothetical protein
MSADSLHVAGVVLITVPAIALVAGPILMPLDFVLSVASPRAENPNRLIYLVPLGRLALSVGGLSDLELGLLSA